MMRVRLTDLRPDSARWHGQVITLPRVPAKGEQIQLPLEHPHQTAATILTVDRVLLISPPTGVLRAAVDAEVGVH